MKRSDVLNVADGLINGERQDEYGPPLKNFYDIAQGWTIIFDKEVQPYEVALAMDWVKTCRLLETIDHKDSWIDKCGYSALGAEFKDEPR